MLVKKHFLYTFFISLCISINFCTSKFSPYKRRKKINSSLKNENYRILHNPYVQPKINVDLQTEKNCFNLESYPTYKKDDREIVFAQSLPTSGGCSTYSSQIISGIQAKFAQINSNGGIQGKYLRLESKNDFDQSEIALENVKNMKKNGFNIFFGNVGTDNVLATLPLIKDQEILMLFPYASDSRLNDDPYLINQINGINNDFLQIDKIVSYLNNSLKIKNVAIFHSNDTHGNLLKDYCIEKLKTVDLFPLAIEHYNPKNLRVLKAAVNLCQKEPEAVICISSHIPTSRLASSFLKQNNYDTKFIGLDNTFFADEILKNTGAKLIYTLCVPVPNKDDYDIVDEYILNMKKYCPDQKVLSYLGLAYYINASIIEKALMKINLSLVDQENLKDEIRNSIESLSNLDLGGFIVDFDYKKREAYPLMPRIVKGHGFYMNNF